MICNKKFCKDCANFRDDSESGATMFSYMKQYCDAPENSMPLDYDLVTGDEIYLQYHSHAHQARWDNDYKATLLTPAGGDPETRPRCGRSAIWFVLQPEIIERTV